MTELRPIDRSSSSTPLPGAATGPAGEASRESRRELGAGAGGSGGSAGAVPANPVAEPLREIDPAELAGAVILLVDDNAQNLELIHAYLESLPCEILTARNGMEAIDLIERHAVDLVLLDVMMPRMSGFEVCQKIKSDPRTRDIVVIMVTALHEFGDYERAHEAGTDDFLTKPVNKLELLIRVKSLLRVRLLKRQLDALRAQLGAAPFEPGPAIELDDDV